jgi:hypothetical protein
MAMRNQRFSETVASANVAAGTFGQTIRVGGQALDAHFRGPGAFHQLQISQDGFNWITATDADAAAITALNAGTYRIVRERPEFVRLHVLQDAGGPQQFNWTLGILKDPS